ncbi:uncharacterized protein LOC109604188 isoform X3 [Aethina tumida]|nr:uncharacterized protein LOC109604188 isoform X3 [Aethina tumida]
MIVVEFNSKTTILKTAQVISDILGQENFRLLNSKSTKVLETFINNTLELIRTVFPQLTTQEKQNIFDILTKIIQMSNMKRPVSLSVGVMALYGGPEDQNLRIKLLGDALNLVCQSPELLNVKIRRNPQCRLVIHALSAHEQNSEKPLLHWSMEHLIEILCKLDSSDSSIASSCHCLELLISDNTIQNHTMVYLERIIRCTIHLFDKDNWNVRNAQMQLIKVIIERYFGVAAAKSCRPKNILDLIIVYPNLRDYFSSLLQTMDVNKKSVMACLYISESNFHNTISHDQSMEETKCIFKTCLEKNLLEFSGYYGELISHSLTAMCPDDEIERDFEQTVEQIIENNYSLCVLKNFLVKLEELYLKYSKKHKLKCYLDKLVLHLQPEEEPLNFLLYRVLPANQILSQLNDKNYNNFQDRIWLHNNLITVDYSNCDVLKYVLENNIGDSLRVKILNIVASQQHCLDNGTMVLKVLVSNMLKSSNKYLISCYYNTILLLIKKSEIHFYPELRQFYSTENLYKIMVLIIFISCGQTNKTNLDLEFVERCVEIYKKEYNNEVIASSLKYLFSCLCCEKLKLDVLKIAFCLFLNVETNTEICDFFNCTMNEFYSIPILSLKHFLTYENLIKHLSHLNVGKFLKEIHDFTTNLNDVFSDSDTFYLVQNDSVVPKSLLVKILYICMSEYMDNCFYCVLLTKRFTGQITTRTKKKKKKNKRRGKNPKNVFLCVSNTFEDTCCVFRIIKTGSENIL